MATEKLTKLRIDLNDADMKTLAKLRRQMEAEQGRVSTVAVIRAAIRKAAK